MEHRFIYPFVLKNHEEHIARDYAGIRTLERRMSEITEMELPAHVPNSCTSGNSVNQQQQSTDQIPSKSIPIFVSIHWSLDWFLSWTYPLRTTVEF